MAELILLDAESIFAFGSLYPGDISECVKGTYISFGAFCEGKPAALITLEAQDGEMVIDWIYTAPDFRRKGVMTELLEFAIKCMEDGIGPTVVRVFCCDSDIRAFLEKREFYFDAGKAGVTCVSEFGNRKSLYPGDITVAKDNIRIFKTVLYLPAVSSGIHIYRAPYATGYP